MRSKGALILAAVFLIPCSCKKKDAPRPPAPPAPALSTGGAMEAIGDIARYQAPKGWQRQENTFGENYAVFYTIPFKEIRVQLNGGSSSIYRTPAEFLNSFSVPTQDQESFVMLRLTQVAGKPISLYERRFKQIKKNPHQLGKQEDTYVREEFCVIPARQRYLVLAYSVMGPDPTRLDIASPEWSALLSSFQLTR